MHQAFHIFRKDVRHFWPHILILLSMLSAFVYLDSAAAAGDQRRLIMYRQPLSLILLLAWFYVLAMVIQDEPLCGDRQFWITRPYNWRSLAVAKGMFALAFINAPLFASDCVRLWLAGYSPASQIPELLWRQVPLTAGIFLGAAAVASVTGGIGHFTLWGLLLITVTVLCSTALEWAGWLGSWGGLNWMRSWVAITCLITAWLFVILRQYSRRTPTVARAVLLAGIVLSVLSQAALPWSLAFAIQSHLPEPDARSAGIRVAFDSSRAAQVELPDPAAPKDPVRVAIPLQVIGLAPDTELATDTANISIERAGSPAWHSGWTSRISLRKEGEGYWVSVSLDPQILDRLESGPLNLHSSMAMTVFAKAATVIAPGPGDFRLTNGLACSIEGWYPRESRLRCTALGRRSRTLVRTENPATGSSTSDDLIAGGPYGPDATFFTLSPIAVFGARLPRLAPADQSGSRLVFTTQRPIAHILRELSIAGLRLVSQPKRTT